MEVDEGDGRRRHGSSVPYGDEWLARTGRDIVDEREHGSNRKGCGNSTGRNSCSQGLSPWANGDRWEMVVAFIRARSHSAPGVVELRLV